MLQTRSVPLARGRSFPVSGKTVVLGLTTVMVIYLVLAPLGMLALSSVKSTAEHLPFEPGPFTLANYQQVFLSPVTYELLGNSVLYAGASVAIGLGLAISFSWILERTDIPLRSLFVALLMAPMAMPAMVLAMAWVLLASPTIGLINLALREVFGLTGQGPLNIYTLWGMILVTSLSMVPSIYIMISGAFRRMDPALEDASQVFGVSGWRTFRLITLPLLLPALAAAAMYYFVIGLEVFEVAAILGVPKGIHVFSTLIFETVHPARAGLPNYGMASSYGAVLLVIIVLLLYGHARLTGKQERFVTVTGRGYRPRLIHLGHGFKLVCVAALSLYFLFSTVLPLSVLVWASLFPTYSIPTPEALSRLGLRNYSNVLSFPGLGQALMNTLIIVLVVATATVLLAAIASWMSVRGRFWGHAIPDRLTFASVATPSVVLGLALIVIYLTIPLPIYGTIWIIVIAYTTRYLSFGTRVMGPAYLQIHRELEEAASVGGVSWGPTMRHIIFPLVAPSLLRTWLWSVIHALREAPMALLLASAQSQTIAVIMFVNWTEGGRTSMASALAVVLVCISGVLTVFMARLRQFRPGEEAA